MFSVTLKKQQKLRLLLRQIGDTSHKDCLLVTNGDNNGALNHHFRRHGGHWTWVENEDDHIAEMQELLDDPVLLGEPSRIPAPDACFDVVVSIDVHEHLDDCVGFNRELQRVTRPGGTVVVTTPNGDAWKPVTILKQLAGMTKEKYGHKVIGYNLRQHQSMLQEAGLETVAGGSYSKFFTEMLEFFINFAYVMVLGKRGGNSVKSGTIAPSSGSELRSVEKQYRIYAAAYPILRAISALDALLFFFTGYAVSAVARRPA
jgi:SAM-dependent methyltransferase